MKRTHSKRLHLNKITLRRLDAVRGGFEIPTYLPTADSNGTTCLTKKDTLCGGCFPQTK